MILFNNTSSSFASIVVVNKIYNKEVKRLPLSCTLYNLNTKTHKSHCIHCKFQRPCNKPHASDLSSLLCKQLFQTNASKCVIGIGDPFALHVGNVLFGLFLHNTSLV